MRALGATTLSLLCSIPSIHPDLYPVLYLVVDSANNSGIIQKSMDLIDVVHVDIAMCVQGRKQGTELATLLMVRVKKMLWPILTDGGLFVHKSRSQLQINALSSRSRGLEINLFSIMVLKADLRSMKSNLTLMFLLSQWYRAESCAMRCRVPSTFFNTTSCKWSRLSRGLAQMWALTCFQSTSLWSMFELLGGSHWDRSYYVYWGLEVWRFPWVGETEYCLSELKMSAKTGLLIGVQFWKPIQGLHLG